MRNPNIDELLVKLLADEISTPEMEQLLLYLRAGHQQELSDAIDNAFKKNDYAHMAANSRPELVLDRILKAGAHQQTITEQIATNENSRRKIFSAKMAWVAAASIIVFFGWTAFTFFTAGNKAVSPQIKSLAPEAAAFTRYLILPDSSTVVLKANSKLEYASTFSSSAREVTLTGEAYFDIRHDEKKPFIIHTGTIKTVVLGTAFNIKAFPETGEVTVSVARGKVRVESQKNIIAVLLPDQQVTYSTATKTRTQKQVNTNKIVTEWTTTDMVFETVPMLSIVETLSRRYGININVKNPSLMECPVKITFSGTESLTDVLAALCTVTNSRFTGDGKDGIIIDGEGCQ